MDEDKKTVILIILIILVIVLLAGGVFFVLNMNKQESNNDNSKAATTENSKTNVEKNSIGENNKNDANLDNWIGRYEKGDIIISLYRTGYDTITFDIETNNTGNNYVTDYSAFFIEISDKKLYSNRNSFGDTYTIEIEKTSNGITVKASSTDEESLLNYCSGEYEIKEFEKLGWTGIYSNNENTIIISEIYEDNLYIVLNSENSTKNIGHVFDEVSNDEIYYETEFFDKKEEMRIQKTSKGIKVEASSEDEDNLFNYISGDYTKEK